MIRGMSSYNRVLNGLLLMLNGMTITFIYVAWDLGRESSWWPVFAWAISMAVVWYRQLYQDNRDAS